MPSPLRPPPYAVDERSLAAETRVDIFTAGGPGGQHRNKTQNAVRLHHAPSGEATAQLEAARGEWEPFQIVVHATGGALAGVRAEASPLVGPSTTIAAPRLARVEYLPVTTPSSVEGKAGAWPDALVPDVDDF